MKLRQQQALSADCWEITRETPSFHKTSQPLQGHQFPVFPDYQLQESNILSKNVDDCVWVNADYPLLFAYKHKHTLTHPHVHNLLWGVKQVGGTCKETQSPLFPGIVQHTEWCILWAVSVWRINHTSHWNVSFVNTLTHFFTHSEPLLPPVWGNEHLLLLHFVNGHKYIYILYIHLHVILYLIHSHLCHYRGRVARLTCTHHLPLFPNHYTHFFHGIHMLAAKQLSIVVHFWCRVQIN